MQQVQHTDAREGLGDDVREYGARGASIHRFELGEDVVQLGERVDDDEYVRNLQIVRVPEEHPRADADVSQGVVRRVFDDGVEFLLVGGRVGVEAPETVKPGELEELLGEEEGGDEVGLRAEEGEVSIVDVHHGGGREDAILLGGEVVDEGCWGQVAGGGERDTHRGLFCCKEVFVLVASGRY